MSPAEHVRRQTQMLGEVFPEMHAKLLEGLLGTEVMHRVRENDVQEQKIDRDDRPPCKSSMDSDVPGLLCFPTPGPAWKVPIMMRNFGGPSCCELDWDFFKLERCEQSMEVFCDAPLVAFVDEMVFCVFVIVSVLIPESKEIKASSS